MYNVIQQSRNDTFRAGWPLYVIGLFFYRDYWSFLWL